MLTTGTCETGTHGAYLGASENGTPVWFTGEGGLVTVAPPGAGKGQAQIIPNLLTWAGPAIVLDIKGENRELTGNWRAQNIGSVLNFAPFEADSACYNPLDFIRTDDTAHLWDDARLAAEMLIVQQKGEDFWESRGRDLLGSLIAHTKLRRRPEEQNMQTVMDQLYPASDDLDMMFVEWQNSPLRAIQRTGNVFATMPDKQREGIFDSARRHMEIWQSARIEKITSKSDWHPADFWKPPWKTLYLSIPVGQVKTYASVLRILLGQHIKGLIESSPTPEERRQNSIPPILLLIDEMPQLGYMEPIAYAIEVGRSYGLRPWLFAQSIGQLRHSYSDADGLMEMCYVQCFMNPEFELARKLSSRVGKKSNLFDNAKRPVIEPQDLMEEEWAGRILAFCRGYKPMKLNKVMAYAAEPFKSRMNTGDQANEPTGTDD